VGQSSAVVRDNLEWREFDDAKVAEVMRRTSEIVGAPDNRNIGRYFAEMEKVIAEVEAEVAKPAHAARPTKAEVEATMQPGDLRREDGGDLAAAA